MSNQSSSLVLRGYRLLAWLLAASVVAQVAFAGLSVFGAASWIWHVRFSWAVEALPLLMLLLALIGRLRGRLMWLPAATFGLIALQHATATIGGAVGALHAINALAIFGLAIAMTRAAMAEHLTKAAGRPAVVDGEI